MQICDLMQLEFLHRKKKTSAENVNQDWEVRYPENQLVANVTPGELSEGDSQTISIKLSGTLCVSQDCDKNLKTMQVSMSGL